MYAVGAAEDPYAVALPVSYGSAKHVLPTFTQRVDLRQFS